MTRNFKCPLPSLNSNIESFGGVEEMMFTGTVLECFYIISRLLRKY